MAEFSLPTLVEAPARGNPYRMSGWIWQQKTRIVELPDGEEIMTLAFFVLTQYRRVTDRRTDRERDRHVALAETRASIASRGKKSSPTAVTSFINFYLHFRRLHITALQSAWSNSSVPFTSRSKRISTLTKTSEKIFVLYTHNWSSHYFN